MKQEDGGQSSSFVREKREELQKVLAMCSASIFAVPMQFEFATLSLPNVWMTKRGTRNVVRK
jgi:hypothetical protein